MRSNRTITLFADRPEFSQGPSSFVASIVVHCVVFGAIGYGVAHQPHVRHRDEHYDLRKIEFHEDPSKPTAPHRKLTAPNLKPAGQTQKPAAKPRPAPALAQQIPQLETGPQTIIQPKTPFHLKDKQEIPVPQIVIWTPEQETPKTIVPPQPQPLTGASVEPSLAPPNEEVELAPQPIAASDKPSPLSPVSASATSPIRLDVPDAPQLPPVQSSNAAAQPTPAAVLSLSDLRMNEGSAQLPPLNETVRSRGAGLTGTKADGSGNAPGAGSSDGVAAEQSPAESKIESPAKADESKEDAPLPEKPAKPAPELDKKTEKPQPDGHQTEADSHSALEDGRYTTERISLPANGQFGVVVIGSSLQERYPEVAQLWGGRLSYSVYLHVGTARSWTLQYTLPRTGEAEAAGSIARIEAPWPYSIVRPNIPPGEINADALMVHGFINAEGRFEDLTVAFPADFTLKQFVVDSLSQWQFRPAQQNGHKVRVEVLLIIPEVQ